MGKMIKMGLVGLVLFGISAAASMTLRPKPEEDADATEQASQESSVVATMDSPEYESNPVPSFVPGGVSAETVLRLAETIKRRERELTEREASVAKKEQQLKFMFDDMRREREVITALVTDAENHAQIARSMLEQFQDNSLVSDGSSTESPESERPSDPNSTEQDDENIETISQWLRAMPPEQSADSIRTMCNDGKMDMVVRVLSFLEEKDVAKILGALEDPVMVAEIIERFRLLRMGR